MSDTALPQPLQINIPRETLEREYLNVLINRSPDSAWHFNLNLHRTTRIAPDGKTAPTAAEPFVTLALFQKPAPLADLEIFGVYLPVEIDTADWLALWLERHSLIVASSKTIPTQRGVFGDYVCTWDTPEGPFAGRFSALRWGTRVFFLALRTPRENYPAMADDYFVAAASFAPVEVDGNRLNGEEHQIVKIAAPMPLSITLPISYTVSTDLSDPRISAYGGDQQALAELPNEQPFGKMNVLLADASLADHPAKAAALYLNPLMKNPITLGGDEFKEEGAIGPFGQTWLMVALATFKPEGLDEIPCELRCRVMWHEKAWFIAGVLGPARNVGPIAWMRNKRALDLVTQSATAAEK